MATYEKAGPHVIHETIDGEAVILNFDTGNYYSLRGSGESIWAALIERRTTSDIADLMRAKYADGDDTIRSAISALCAQLVAENLIRPSDEAAEHFGLASEPAGTAPFAPPVLEKFDDMQDLIMLDPIHEVDATEGWPRPSK